MLKQVSKPKANWSAFAIQGVILNWKEVPNVSDTPDVTETGAAIAGKPKSPSKKNKNQKMKKTIEAAITLTKVARATETQVTSFALQDLIVQQMDKNATSVPDAADCHTISATAILH